MPKKLSPVLRLPRGYSLYQNSDGYWQFYKDKTGHDFPELRSMEYLTRESAINGAWTDYDQVDIDRLNSESNNGP